MSIWSHVFDSEWSQRSDINSLKERSRSVARSQQTRNRKLETRIADLEGEVGELALLCRGLLTALREGGTLNPEAFQEVMNRIDLEDGVLDGKVTPAAKRPIRSKPRRR